MSSCDTSFDRLVELPLRRREIWQGGLFRSPGWSVRENGDHFRAWVAIWVSVLDHKVHASDLCMPEDRTPDLASKTLVEFALDRTTGGYRPGTVQTNDPHLAALLKAPLGDLGIRLEVKSPLRSVEEILEAMEVRLRGRPVPPDALDVSGVTVERMRAFADAARHFYQARPWHRLVNGDIIEIEQPASDPETRFAVVLGAGSTEYGLAFGGTLAQMRQMIAWDHRPRFPFWSMLFGCVNEMTSGDADLWEDHDLPLAGPGAYPALVQFGPDGRLRRPSPARLAFVEGLMRALAESSEEEIDSGCWTRTAETFDGPVQFTLALPDLLQPPQHRPGHRDHRSAEGFLTQALRYLQEHPSQSNEEAQRLLNERFSGVPLDEMPSIARNDRERAQALIYRAFDAHGRMRIKLAREALQLDPDCADAYVIQAEHVNDRERALPLYERGVTAGERALGQAPLRDDSREYWGDIETRPYMRARFGLGLTLFELGRIEEAAGHFRALLKLNPEDNQGVRYHLIPALLALEQHEELAELLDEYDEEVAVRNWASLLLSFRQSGDSPESRQALRAAQKQNRYVADLLLLDRLELEEGAERGYWSPGKPSEAAMCAELLGQAWRRTPGAMDWLREAAGAPPTSPPGRGRRPQAAG